MATLTSCKNGSKRIQFFDGTGNRHSITLQKMNLKEVARVMTKVEELLKCKTANIPWDLELSQWVAGVGDDLARKLADVGLLPVIRKNAELDAFTKSFIESRTDAKATTRRALLTVQLRIVEYFGAKRIMRDITSADADNFKIFLLGKYSQATAGRTVRAASQFFRAALRAGLIPKNIFEDVKAPSEKNKSRMFEVNRPMLEKLFDACPDHQWKMIIALSRLGGLRNPSEVLLLKWSDINWELNKFLVHSPKTEHHEGKATRWVPLFDDGLKKILEEGFHLAKEGEVFVINRYREAKQNLRTTFEKIIYRAGLTPWPKLFANMRSSRQTELARSGCPTHLVVAWLGNSEKIANDHYLQVNDTDYENAGRWVAVKSECNSGAVPSANRVQQAVLPSRKESHNLTQLYTRCGLMRLETTTILNINGRYRIRTCDPQRVELVL